MTDLASKYRVSWVDSDGCTGVGDYSDYGRGLVAYEKQLAGFHLFVVLLSHTEENGWMTVRCNRAGWQ